MEEHFEDRLKQTAKAVSMLVQIAKEFVTLEDIKALRDYLDEQEAVLPLINPGAYKLIPPDYWKKIKQRLDAAEALLTCESPDQAELEAVCSQIQAG